jgi:hypothetical protein
MWHSTNMPRACTCVCHRDPNIRAHCFGPPCCGAPGVQFRARRPQRQRTWIISCPRCRQPTCRVFVHFCHRMRCSGPEPCPAFEAECQSCDYPGPPGQKRYMKSGRGYTVAELRRLPIDWNHPAEPLPPSFRGRCRCRACRAPSTSPPSAGPAGLSSAYGATIFGSNK